ncbi:MAG: Glutamine--scyllo-inositol transaminase [Gammaproteobacteria bacterium]|nr:Glutamine--scyllo-inositol transaminase [Gammaproteobacteria bacterium]
MLINNLFARIEQNKAPIQNAFDRVMKSGWLILGPEVKQFEAAFADYIGTKHCVTLANGTDAIELALKAMGVKSGDRVATVANAGMYTTTALLAIGAEPYYLDVDLTTRNTTLSEVNRAIAAGVKAVVITHLYGLATPEIHQIAQHCQQHNISLLEDCAQAHGALVNGQRVGTFGDAASFSFYPTKNLGALGDGGAIVTNSAQIAEKVSQLRQYGWTSKYHVEVANARNSRLDELQAAILLAFLPQLDTANARRREIATQYNDCIQHPNVIAPRWENTEFVGHLYVIRSMHRDNLRAHLKDAGIGSDIHYPIPDYQQPVFGQRFTSLKLENTERLAAEVLTLPCYPEMTDTQVAQVATAINDWPTQF